MTAADQQGEATGRRGRRERMTRLDRIEALAAEQGGVVSRRQVYAEGMTRGEVRAHVRARRWQRVWSRSICVHRGEIGQLGRWWAASFEGGSRAMVDGDHALVASGLTGYDPEEVISVAVPRGVRAVRAAGLAVRQTRRWRVDDAALGGVPRTRVPVAAVRGAMRARSDKQAALLLTMPVQQRLTTAVLIGEVLLTVRRHRRRALMHAVVLDLLDGVRSLGELEFAQECRRRGLPEPSRQVLRRGPDGRYYLDVCWDDLDVVVEIDGIQHSWAQNAVGDALRHNEVTLQAATVLRLPLLGLRIAADDFFAQIERALLTAGERNVMGSGRSSSHSP